VLVSSFTGKLGNWAPDHDTEIYELATVNDLIEYIRAGFSIEDIEGKSLYILLRLEQGEKSLHDYTQEFNTSYAWWKSPSTLRPPYTWTQEWLASSRFDEKLANR
jgi:hypothetical protein